MPAVSADKMHSVNVKMTDEMIQEMDRLSPNRSGLVRRICAAILKAYDEGNAAPFEQAISTALRSSSRAQKMTRTTGVLWRKAIVWIPERMHERLEEITARFEIRPADFIRGAVIGYTEKDPVPDIVTQGHEIWKSEAVDETNRADG